MESKMIKKPDFFIVGAPKCGTTALYEYLRPHPEIFMPEVKEIHFFGSDLEFKNKTIDMKMYLSLFSSAQNEKRIGEASAWYLYSNKAAEEINRFSPNSKIIIMLRNPVDLLYSNYYQFLYNENEDIKSFEGALIAEPWRKQGRLIPKRAHFVQGLFYFETIRFTEQIRRYIDNFGRQRLHIIIYDDLKKNIVRVYKDALAFLEVDLNFQPNFKVINPNKKSRSKILRRILVNRSFFFRVIGKILVPKAYSEIMIKKLINYSKECDFIYNGDSSNPRCFTGVEMNKENISCILIGIFFIFLSMFSAYKNGVSITFWIFIIVAAIFIGLVFVKFEGDGVEL